MNSKSTVFPAVCSVLLFSLAIAPASAGLLINEVLADPHPDSPPSNPNGDSNGDGIRDGSADEFIELVNDMATPLDISGYTISDAVTVRHTFQGGTVIPAGGGVVVFGGETPTGSFGGAIVQIATEGFLGFNNNGDTITISDGTSDIATFTYPGDGFTGTDQSMTRDPDITGGFVDHSTLPSEIVHSPGYMNDGVTPLPEPGTGIMLLLVGTFAITLARRRNVAT